MSQAPPPVRDEDFPEPPRLRRLRLLVSLLLLVLIGGVIIVVASLVINLAAFSGAGGEGGTVAAETLVLPAGEEITSVGEGPGVLLIVTRDPDGVERLHRFDRTTGEALSVTELERE